MGLGHSPSIVTSGLSFYLDAANKKSYTGTGATWVDISGSGNTGTLLNNPVYNAAGYISFNYTLSQSATVPNNSNIRFLNRDPYTLEAWVYPTRNPGANNWTGILDRESNAGAGRDGYNLYFLGSSSAQTYFFTERWCSGTYTNVSVTVDQSLSVNQWSHLAATYDGTTLSLYRNGVSVSTPTSSVYNLTNSTKSLTVGVRGGQYFDGNIANVKIYNKSLSSIEIQQNFNALRGRFGL